MGLDFSQSLTFLPILYVVSKFLLLVFLLNACFEVEQNEKSFAFHRKDGSRLEQTVFWIFWLHESIFDTQFMKRIKIGVNIFDYYADFKMDLYQDVGNLIVLLFYSTLTKQACPDSNSWESLIPLVIWIVLSFCLFFMELIHTRASEYVSWIDMTKKQYVYTSLVRFKVIIIAIFLSDFCLNIPERLFQNNLFLVKILVYSILMTIRLYLYLNRADEPSVPVSKNFVFFAFIFFLSPALLCMVLGLYMFVIGSAFFFQSSTKLASSAASTQDSSSIYIDPVMMAKLQEMEKGALQTRKRSNVF